MKWTWLIHDLDCIKITKRMKKCRFPGSKASLVLTGRYLSYRWEVYYGVKSWHSSSPETYSYHSNISQDRGTYFNTSRSKYSFHLRCTAIKVLKSALHLQDLEAQSCCRLHLTCACVCLFLNYQTVPLSPPRVSFGCNKAPTVASAADMLLIGDLHVSRLLPEENFSSHAALMNTSHNRMHSERMIEAFYETFVWKRNGRDTKD